MSAPGPARRPAWNAACGENPTACALPANDAPRNFVCDLVLRPTASATFFAKFSHLRAVSARETPVHEKERLRTLGPTA